MKIAVLASGSGSNLQAIIDNIKSGNLKNCEISVVISNKESAYALERARKAGIEAVYVNYKDYPSREDYDKRIVEIMKAKGVELVVLAGYLKWITPYFVNAFRNSILNIHPSLLPSFKGLEGIKQAFDYGVRVTGVTVHFVDETEDGGAVILQEAVQIEKSDTLETLAEKIHKVEHKLYPLAIQYFIDGKLAIDGRKVIIK